MPTVAGETEEDSIRRVLRVIALLKQFNQPELWRHVVEQVLPRGVLDMEGMLTRETLPLVMFLLSSCAAENITFIE